MIRRLQSLLRALFRKDKPPVEPQPPAEPINPHRWDGTNAYLLRKGKGRWDQTNAKLLTRCPHNDPKCRPLSLCDRCGEGRQW